MRRKTAPKDPVHPMLSRSAQSDVGLIAKAEEWAQSTVGEYVLDNRSYRTIALIERLKGRGCGAAQTFGRQIMDGPASPAAAERTRRAGRKLTHLQAWALERAGEGHTNRAAVALANKLARIAWAVWRHERQFDGDHALQHAVAA